MQFIMEFYRNSGRDFSLSPEDFRHPVPSDLPAEIISVAALLFQNKINQFQRIRLIVREMLIFIVFYDKTKKGVSFHVNLFPGNICMHQLLKFIKSIFVFIFIFDQPNLAIDFGGMKFIGVNCLDNLAGRLSANGLHKAELGFGAPGNAELPIGFMYKNPIQYANRTYSHNLTEGGFSYPPNLNSNGGSEDPPSVGYSSATGNFEIASDVKIH